MILWLNNPAITMDFCQKVVIISVLQFDKSHKLISFSQNGTSQHSRKCLQLCVPRVCGRGPIALIGTNLYWKSPICKTDLRFCILVNTHILACQQSPSVQFKHAALVNASIYKITSIVQCLLSIRWLYFLSFFHLTYTSFSLLKSIFLWTATV